MAETFTSLLAHLEQLAAYDGPWRPLRDETPLLAERVKELRERERRLDSLLIVALVGGSGVGKSTMLNALAGDELAATSEFRPCTSIPTVYYPSGAHLDFPGWRACPRSALEHLVLIDTPDSDTIVLEHREIVIEALSQCDLILLCGSPEKYLDEATWSLLRPLRGERRIVCVETKAHERMPSIRDHWMTRLKGQGFTVSDYFRVNALRAFDRKLHGGGQGEDFDFPRLERFLRDVLDEDHIQRIKRSNALGLLRRTLDPLRERVLPAAEGLNQLAALIERTEYETLRSVMQLQSQRVFAETHLWLAALSSEIGLRAKFSVGACFRMFDTIRSLPARLTPRIPGMPRFDMFRQPVSPLSGATAASALVAEDAIQAYRTRRSRLDTEFSKLGFDVSRLKDLQEEGLNAFREEIGQRISAVINGPARADILYYARVITNWPVSLVLEAGPALFVLMTGWRIVSNYFASLFLPATFFINAFMVFCIIMSAELFLISLAARGMAWLVRRNAHSHLRRAFNQKSAIFAPHATLLAATQAHLSSIQGIFDAIDGKEKD